MPLVQRRLYQLHKLYRCHFSLSCWLLTRITTLYNKWNHLCCNHWMFTYNPLSKLHFRNWWKLWMVTSCWNICRSMCIIYILFCSLRNYNFFLLTLGINLCFKWNIMYCLDYMLIIYNLSRMRKCRNWRSMLLCCPNRHSHHRNLQIIIMYRCHRNNSIKYHNPYRMRWIHSNNSLYNFRNRLYFIKYLWIIHSPSWLCLGNWWSLLLGHNNISCNSNNTSFNNKCLQIEAMHRFIIDNKCLMLNSNHRSQMCL